MQRFIGITGNPGTGKSMCAEHLAQNGFAALEGSDIIAAEAKKAGVNIRERADYGRFHVAMQKQFGQDWLAQVMLGMEEDDIVFSGVRVVANSNRIQQEHGLLVGLICPPEICLERMDKTDPKNPKTIDEYYAQVAAGENPAAGIGANTVIGHADVLIDTSQPKELCLSQLDQAIASHFRADS